MIRIYSYSKEAKRMEMPTIADLPRHINDPGRMLWVDLEDPNDEEAGVLDGMFGFHALAIEDCLQGNPLPKIDVYEGYLFIAFHAVDTNQTSGTFETAEIFETVEVDVFTGDNHLVTFHRRPVKGIFDTRGWVAKNPGSLLRSPDWLLHGILNSLIDHFGPPLKQLETRIQNLERELLDAPREAHLREILSLRREIFHLIRITGPQTDILHRMERGDLPWVQDVNLLYFRDLHDRLQRISRSGDLYRDMLAGLTDIHLSVLSNRTTGALRTLSAVSLLVLPPALVAAVYGIAPTLFGPAGTPVPLGIIGALLLGGALLLKKSRWF
jgi:magnesium transporter